MCRGNMPQAKGNSKARTSLPGLQFPGFKKDTGSVSTPEMSVSRWNQKVPRKRESWDTSGWTHRGSSSLERFNLGWRGQREQIGWWSTCRLGSRGSAGRSLGGRNEAQGRPRDRRERRSGSPYRQRNVHDTEEGWGANLSREHVVQRMRLSELPLPDSLAQMRSSASRKPRTHETRASSAPDFSS